jgi:ribonuclease HI
MVKFKENPMDGLVLSFDGSCVRNPGGPGGWGWRLCHRSNGELVACDEGRLAASPDMTNNVAEFLGLIEGLRHVAVNHRDASVLQVRGDSKLVVEIMSRNWRAKKPHLKQLAHEAGRWVSEIGWERVSFRWVPREQNAECDALSKGVRVTPVPRIKERNCTAGPMPLRTDFVRAFDCRP